MFVIVVQNYFEKKLNKIKRSNEDELHPGMFINTPQSSGH